MVSVHIERGMKIEKKREKDERKNVFSEVIYHPSDLAVKYLK